MSFLLNMMHFRQVRAHKHRPSAAQACTSGHWTMARPQAGNRSMACSWASAASVPAEPGYALSNYETASCRWRRYGFNGTFYQYGEVWRTLWLCDSGGALRPEDACVLALCLVAHCLWQEWGLFAL